MLLALLFLLSPAHAQRAANAVAPPNECAAAKRKTTVYAMGLRAYCSKDEDCASFSLSGDTCDEPIAFRKDAHVSDDKTLHDLQEKVKAACQKEWSARAECKAPIVKPVCREGKCAELK